MLSTKTLLTFYRMKKISIILLNLNRVKETEQCIQTLLNENYSNMEFIVVEQADNQEVLSMLKKYPKVKVIQTHENLGLEGWNVGCRNATGELLLVLDDDSYPITSETLCIAEKRFSEDRKLAVIAPKIVNSDGIQWPRFLKEEKQKIVGFTANAWFIRKDIFEKIGYYPKEYFMFFNELAIAPKIINLGYKLEYHPDLVFFHLAAPNSRLNAWRIHLFTRNEIWNTLRFDPFYLFPISFLYINIEMFLKAVKNKCVNDGYIKGLKDGLKRTKELRFKNNEICYSWFYFSQSLRVIFKSITNIF